MIADLEVKNEEFKNRIIRNIQYISENTTTQISLVSGIIYWRYLSKIVLDQILSDRVINIDDRQCEIQHPDLRFLISLSAKINSSILSRKRNT